MRDAAETLRERQRLWLQRVLAENNVKATPLARAIGIAATTLTRKLNDPDDMAILTDLVVKKIVDHLGIAAPNFLSDEPAPAASGRIGFAESEAEPYEIGLQSGDTGTLMRAILAARPGLDPWRLKTRALEYLGYLVGDIVWVDLNRSARSGNIVCAQVYDWANPARTKTVFRVYNQPYLVAAGPGQMTMPPLLVDNQNVLIKGVLVASMRDSLAPPPAAN